MIRIRHKVLLAFIWLYAAYLFVYAVQQISAVNLWWPFDLLNWAVPFTLAITIFFLLWTFRLKKWLLAGFLGVLLLASIWNVRDLWGNGPTFVDPQQKSYLVMTHNTGNGLADPAALVEVLRQSGADIIGLQEITEQQAQSIQKQLAFEYPYQLLFGAGIPGKGLLSKFPILNHQQIELYPDRPDLVATIKLDNSELTVIIAHPPPPRIHSDGIYMNAATRQQMDTLISLATHGGPVLLLGDFNMTTRSILYARFREHGLVDAFEQAGTGPGFTLPKRWKNIPLLPLARVDYIWHTQHLQPVRSWIGQPTGSDHLPVLARLQWQTNGRLQ